MAQNWKVELDGNATRVIDGDRLKAQDEHGKKMEAIAIYARMMGIRSTDKEYKVTTTDDPPTPTPEPVTSDAEKIAVSKEAEVYAMIGQAVASAVAKEVGKVMAELRAEMGASKRKPE